MPRHSLVLACLLALAACRQSDAVVNPPPGSGGKGVYIVNEGGFSGGASLAFYDTERDTLLRFVTAAESSWLFPNDMKIAGTKGYVAVSGSNAVVVVDLATHQAAKSIALPAGPGFLASAGSSLYSANYDGTVSRIDMTTDSLIGSSIPVVGFPGGIAVAAGKVFVSDIGLYPSVGEWLKVLDPLSLAVVDSVRTGGSPGQMAVAGGRLFVVATAVAKVYAVQPSGPTLADSADLGEGFLSDLSTDGTTLFVLSGDSVAKLSASPLQVETGGFIGRSLGLYCYSLAADPSSGDLYLGTVTGSAGGGVLEIFTSAGVRKRGPTAVGTFPGAYAFR